MAQKKKKRTLKGRKAKKRIGISRTALSLATIKSKPGGGCYRLQAGDCCSDALR